MKLFDGYENKIFEKYFSTKLRSLIKKDFEPNRYKYFKTTKEIKEWGEPHSTYFKKIRKLRDTLFATKEQIEELELFDYYAGYGSEKINNYLRGIPIFLMNEESVKNYLINLENYINKFTLTENIISVRLMPSEFINKDYKKGRTFIEKGFLSSSLNLDYRLDYQSSRTMLKNKALLIMKIPKGTNATYTEEVQCKSRQRKEYELIIQRNQKIKIESNQKILSNRIIVLSIEKKPKEKQ